jgi:hypothetical protein
VRPRQDAAGKQTDLAAALRSKADGEPGQYDVDDMLDADTRATLRVVCQVDMRRHAFIGVLRRLSHALVRSCAHAPIGMIAVHKLAGSYMLDSIERPVNIRARRKGNPYSEYRWLAWQRVMNARICVAQRRCPEACW